MTKHKEHPRDDYGDKPAQVTNKTVLPDPIAIARPDAEGKRLREMKRLRRDVDKALRS